MTNLREIIEDCESNEQPVLAAHSKREGVYYCSLIDQTLDDTDINCQYLGNACVIRGDKRYECTKCDKYK